MLYGRDGKKGVKGLRGRTPLAPTQMGGANRDV